MLLFLLWQQFRRDEIAFQKKMESLQKIIVANNQKKIEQSQKIQLTEEFQAHFKNDSALIGQSIFNLNYELFEMLSKNNLLQ
jgi:hypothetical protein